MVVFRLVVVGTLVAQSSGTDTASDVRLRGEAAVLGAVVADAATMGLHWIYNVDEIKGHLIKPPPEGWGRFPPRGGRNPEFFTPPKSAYYNYPQGSPTPYGVELYSLIETMTARSHGELSPSVLAQRYLESAQTGCTDDTGCTAHRLSGISKALLECRESGAHWTACPPARERRQNHQAHATVKVAPLVARYAGEDVMLEKVEQAIRVHQVRGLPTIPLRATAHFHFHAGREH
jgi:hypothetical protein